MSIATNILCAIVLLKSITIIKWLCNRIFMNILINGLNNYVGRRCASLMADEDFQVFAITRNKKLFQERMSEPLHAQVFEVDLLKGDKKGEVRISNLDASFYFTQVPTLDDLVNLRVELLCLRNFIHMLKGMDCNRLIYVTRLADKRCLEPILDLLKECQMDYTVVLKNVVIGKDSVLYSIYQRMSGKSVLFYSKRYGGSLFRPIGIYDFVRWLKAILKVPAFHYGVLEVGGGELMSVLDLYSLYRKLKLKLKAQRMICLPHWLLRVMYMSKMHDDTEMAEFRKIIHMNRAVDNAWSVSLPFTFSTTKEILLAE